MHKNVIVKILFVLTRSSEDGSLLVLSVFNTCYVAYLLDVVLMIVPEVILYIQVTFLYSSCVQEF